MDVADYARVKGIILGTQIKASFSDATMDGNTDVADYARIKGVILGTQTPHDMYRAEYDYNTAGAGTVDRAASKQVTNMPTVIWPSDIGWTNFTTGDYDDVQAIDANQFSMLANATANNSVQCRFTVFEYICAEDLTHIEVNVTASW